MGASFRLNELGGDPLWLVDGGSNTRIVFVPALAALYAESSGGVRLTPSPDGQ